MAAAELAALSSGDEHERVVPVAGVGDEAHGGAVVAGCGARARCGAALRLAGDAEQGLEPALTPERMEHVQRVKTLPGPVLNLRRSGVLLQMLNGVVGGGDQKFVVALKGSGQPCRGSLGQDALQEGGAAPLVEIGLLAEDGLEQQF